MPAPKVAQILRGRGRVIDSLDILNTTECSNFLEVQSIEPSMFCARSYCQVYRIPNGAPAQFRKQVYNDTSPNFYVYSLVLFVSQKVEPHTPVFTRITDHLSWIEEIIWKSKSTCGKQQNLVQGLMAYSQNATKQEFPWHAAIYERIGYSTDFKIICGGTIINEYSIVTAAHCVTTLGIQLDPGKIKVALGRYDLDEQAPFESIAQSIYIPLGYNKDTLYNDIAIIKLKRTISYNSYIQPVCLSSNTRIFDNPVGTVPGWGFNEFNTTETILKKGSFVLNTDIECSKSNIGFSFVLTTKSFCAGFDNGTAACRGDSGGGLVFEYNNQFYLRGVVSLGFLSQPGTLCDPLQLNLFTNVTEYYEWIMNTIS